MTNRCSDVLGVLLAGGASRRMGGGDKCLQSLAGRSILEHVIERVAPQVGRLVLNANGVPGRFAATGLEVIADAAGDAPLLGPLAGVAACLDWAAGATPPWSRIATFPADAPFLPDDLVVRLKAAADEEGADLARAQGIFGGRAQPVIGLWPIKLREDLRQALNDGIRKVDRWTARHSMVEVPFAGGPPDPFFNINRAEDLAAAEQWLASP